MGFFEPKIPIRVNFEGLWNGECWHVFGHLEHFTAIWYILWPFGNLVVIWYIFPRFGILCQKIWQPCSKACTDNCTGRKKNTFERPCAEETLSFLFSRNDILPHKVDTIIFLLPYQRD
jgi:hypothetical protein